MAVREGAGPALNWARHRSGRSLPSHTTCCTPRAAVVRCTPSPCASSGLPVMRSWLPVLKRCTSATETAGRVPSAFGACSRYCTRAVVSPARKPLLRALPDSERVALRLTWPVTRSLKP
ncbi:hypothetical protein G6F59_016576 [Rhizopus arrhizus]|nr:hypothetical protein G6F59_016576 [Rhizopus arrhizus]